MLRGQSILCFAPDPWNDIWRNRHQIMSRLARENQVLYVEPRAYLRPVLAQLFGGKLSPRELGAKLYEPRPGLYVFRPPRYAPLAGREPLRTLLDSLRAASLRKALRRLGMRRPIWWLFRPDAADVPGRYGEKLLIYHIVDEYTGYADVDAQRAQEIARRERALIARADLVLVTSRRLLESKGDVNPNTYWVPNGVDYMRFARAAQGSAEPPEVENLPHPRIGYVGALNDKIDVALLEEVAKAYPQGTLVLVGPLRLSDEDARRRFTMLCERPNVLFVGPVPVERVPFFMAACDVGLLPYRRNRWTEYIHPLKLYEYLACGLPVVASDIPAAQEEADLLYIAAGKGEFVENIARALAEDAPMLRRARQQRAAQNTWDQRVAKISELIEKALREKA